MMVGGSQEHCLRFLEMDDPIDRRFTTERTRLQKSKTQNKAPSSFSIDVRTGVNKNSDDDDDASKHHNMTLKAVNWRILYSAF
jgi:hypothetical protein